MKIKCSNCKHRGGRKKPGMCLNPKIQKRIIILGKPIMMWVFQDYAMGENGPCQGKYFEQKEK